MLACNRFHFGYDGGPEVFPSPSKPYKSPDPSSRHHEAIALWHASARAGPVCYGPFFVGPFFVLPSFVRSGRLGASFRVGRSLPRKFPRKCPRKIAGKRAKTDADRGFVQVRAVCRPAIEPRWQDGRLSNDADYRRVEEHQVDEFASILARGRDQQSGHNILEIRYPRTFFAGWQASAF